MNHEQHMEKIISYTFFGINVGLGVSAAVAYRAALSNPFTFLIMTSGLFIGGLIPNIAFCLSDCIKESIRETSAWKYSKQ